MSKNIKILSPGRTCLFGDHQDYLGLPVIACAIDRYISLEAAENSTNLFNILLPDISETRSIKVDTLFEKVDHRDYFASSLKVLRRYQCIPNKGYDVVIKGNLPINAGVSSSSALIIAWVRFLIEAFGVSEKVTPVLVSKIAYEAEVIEHGEPGGLMDQYSIGIGDILFINTGVDTSYMRIGDKIEGLIVGESGVKKDTVGTLGDRKEKALEAIAHVKTKLNGFDIAKVNKDEYENYEMHIPEELKPYFFAAVENHSITKRALLEFKKEKPEMVFLGALMNQHHHVLKNILKITVPTIDKMIDAAMQSGAFGAKIVGSGGGGSIVAIAPKEKQHLVVDAIIEAGGKAAYVVNVDQGVRVI